LLQYATARAGVILVNINPAYRTYELQYALNQSGSRMLFAVPDIQDSDYRTMIDSVRDELPQLERVVFLGTEDWVALLGEGADEAALHQRAAELSFDDPINIQYTSGPRDPRRAQL